MTTTTAQMVRKCAGTVERSYTIPQTFLVHRVDKLALTGYTRNMTTTQTTEIRYAAKCRRCNTGNTRVVTNNAEAVDFHHEANSGRVACRNCGRQISQWNLIKGTYSAARLCDERCTSATGHKCECQCGGHNHGADNQ